MTKCKYCKKKATIVHRRIDTRELEDLCKTHYKDVLRFIEGKK